MASKISPVILNSKKTSGTNFVKRLIYIFIYVICLSTYLSIHLYFLQLKQGQGCTNLRSANTTCCHKSEYMQSRQWYHHRYHYYRNCFGKTNKVLQEKNRTTSQAVANNSIDTIFHPETLKTVKKNIGVKKKQEVPSKFVKKTSSLNLAKAPDQVPQLNQHHRE